MNINRNDKINLNSVVPDLKAIKLGIGWDEGEFDLDVSAILLQNNQNPIRDKDDIVYYNNLKHKQGFIIHSGDNLTGAGEGDNEEIVVNLRRVPPEISNISFVLTMHEAELRNHHLGMISGAHIAIYDETSLQKLGRFNIIPSEFSGYDSLFIGQLQYKLFHWVFDAVLEPFNGGLLTIAQGYNVVIAKSQ